MFGERAIRRALQARWVERDKPKFWVREVWVLWPEVEARSFVNCRSLHHREIGCCQCERIRQESVSVEHGFLQFLATEERRMIS